MIVGNAQPAAASWLSAGVICLAITAVPLLNRQAHADSAGIFDPAILNTTDGSQIFEQICQGCHLKGGLGAVGAGHFPALARDRNLASRQYVALTILKGRRNMPAFGKAHAIALMGTPATLSEDQIAAVANYVRTHFDNHYSDSITAAEITSLDR